MMRSNSMVGDLDNRTIKTLYERVARGAAWLDERRPSWFREIKVTQLDLSSAESCVLGQIASRVKVDDGWSGRIKGYFRHFQRTSDARCVQSLLGLEKGLPNLFLVQHGFLVHDNVRWDASGYHYGVLDEAWKQEIATRRKAAREAQAVA